jgi:hypothetical protein
MLRHVEVNPLALHEVAYLHGRGRIPKSRSASIARFRI